MIRAQIILPLSMAGIALCGALQSSGGHPPSRPAPRTASDWITPIGAELRIPRRIDPEVLRRRTVRIDDEQIRRHDASRTRLALPLFNDAVFEGIVRRTAFPGLDIGHPDTVSLSGSLAGQPDGTFAIVAHRGVVAGLISVPGAGDYQIRGVGGGMHEVRQLDVSRFEACGLARPDELTIPRTPPFKSAAGTPGLEDGTRIDVMIVYTTIARDELGSTAAVEAESLLAFDLANIAFENSGIGTRLTLVQLAEIDYPESGDGPTDLLNLTSSGDGFLDQVHGMRNLYGADNVALFVSSALNLKGMGWLIDDPSFNTDNLSFNVSTIDTAAADLTYIHELGHNLGCVHDRPFSGGIPGVFPYSHGYVDPDLVFRTLMAQDPTATRVPHFSSPLITYADTGRVTGVPEGEADEADNAKSVNASTYYMANYRTSVCVGPAPAMDCNHNCAEDADDVVGGVVPDCNGNGIPDFCDIRADESQDCNDNRIPDECEDCNGNRIADSCELIQAFAASTGPKSPIGTGSPVLHTFASPPAPVGPVTFRFSAQADLATSLKTLDIYLNDAFVNSIFRGVEVSCPTTPDVQDIVLTSDDFLTITGGGNATIRIEAPFDVNPLACSGTSFVEVLLQYDTASGVPDANMNGLPDECDLARGDNNLDGEVNVLDLINLLNFWGACPPPCPEDSNADGFVNVPDLIALLNSWG